MEFWILLLPLFYWAFIWGLFYKILPTATASISDDRKLIPLTTIIIGASYLLGSASWTHISRWTKNTACIILASLIHLAALVLSVLIFPKSAGSQILDVDGIDTYIKPDIVYIILIFALIGFKHHILYNGRDHLWWRYLFGLCCHQQRLLFVLHRFHVCSVSIWSTLVLLHYDGCCFGNVSFYDSRTEEVHLDHSELE